MESNRFDRLAQLCGERLPRRAIGRPIVAALGVLGLTFSAPRAGEAKKKCGPCKRRKRGKCKPKQNGIACGVDRTCQGGRCVTQCEGKSSGDACGHETQCFCHPRIAGDGGGLVCGRSVTSCFDLLCNQQSACESGFVCVEGCSGNSFCLDLCT